MTAFQKSIIGVCVLALMAVVHSCGDLGNEVPKSQLASSSNNVTVIKAATGQVTLLGGTAPYFIRTPPDNFIASAILNSSVLIITGVDTGRTFVVISDSKFPSPDSVEIIISVVNPPPPTISFSNQIQPIFDNNHCIHCHPGNGGLDLTANFSYNQLVNIAAQGICAPSKRVKPNDADQSVLYLKVSGTTCGTRMPQGEILTTGEIDLIRDWIIEGALNN